jgi:hypothetical protein
MHEIWLQKYLKENFRRFGFTALYGPYSQGPDFKGVFTSKRVKVEVEWDYSDYIRHGHPLKFADIIVVASLEPIPELLKEKLPPVVINVARERVIDWASPKIILKNADDYHSYPWRRLSRSLLDLYSYYQKQKNGRLDFIGSNLALSMYKSQAPFGFQFASGGNEECFEGLPTDKAAWDYWLEIAHEVAGQFKLAPALLRPTWIDRIALPFTYTGRITEYQLKRFKEIAIFIESWIYQS